MLHKRARFQRRDVQCLCPLGFAPLHDVIFRLRHKRLRTNVILDEIYHHVAP